MTSIPAALRQIVMQRAHNACEYCGLSQEGQEATFHIDHIIPRAAGGATISENLALDVHFVNPLPVMQRPAYRVWAETRHGRIVEAAS